METLNRFIRFALVLSATVIPGIALAANFTPGQKITIGVVTDIHGVKRNVVMPVGTAEQVAATSPANERKEWASRHAKIVQMCNSKHPYPLEFVSNFTVQKMAMNASVSLSASWQVITNNDPSGIQHWAVKSFTDPVGWESFAAFQLASDATAKFFKMAGMVHDPCSIIKRASRNGVNLTAENAMLQMEASRSQRVWGHLMGPIGMAAGSLASSIVSDLLVDKNLKLCAYSQIKELPAQQERAAQQACDQFYHDWVESNRILNYVPDLLGGVATAVVMATPGILTEVSPPVSAFAAKNAAKLTRLGLRSLPTLARQKATGALVGAALNLELAELGTTFVELSAVRVTMAFGAAAMGVFEALPSPITWLGIVIAKPVATFVVFNQVQDLWMIPINSWWYPLRDGHKISEVLGGIENELGRASSLGWNWQPMPNPAFCSQPNVMELQMPSGGPLDGFSNAMLYANEQSMCERKELTPGKVISTLHDQYKEWRSYLLQTTNQAAGNWKDHILQFANMVTNAKSLYSGVAESIYYQNTGQNKDGQQLPYYSRQLFFGLPLHPAMNICSFDADSKALIQAGIAEAQKSISEGFFDSNQATIIKNEILPGLEAFDCSNPNFLNKQNLDAIFAKMTKAGIAINQIPKVQLVETARYFAMQKAIQTLHRYVYSDPTYGLERGGKLTVPELSDGFMFLAKSNPFLRLHAILGFPTPLPLGEQDIMGANTAQGMFTPGQTDLHPNYLERVQTPTMAEYLLASMVCGPDTSAATVYNDSVQPSLLPRVLVDIWSGNSAQTTVNMGSMIGGHWGTHIMFYPPHMIDNPGVDFCNTNPVGGIIPVGGFSMHDKVWTEKGHTYRGLLDVVRQHLSREIMAGDPSDKTKSNFPGWWDKYIDPRVASKLQVFQAAYKQIMDEKFIPVLNSTAVEQHSGRPLAMGLKSSLRQELIVNLSYLWTTYQAGRKVNAADAAKFDAAKNDVVKKFDTAFLFFGGARDINTAMALVASDFKSNQPDGDLIGQHVTSVHHPKAQKVFAEGLKTAFTDSVTKLKGVVAENKGGTPGATATLNEVNNAASANITALYDDLTEYFGMLTTVEF